MDLFSYLLIGTLTAFWRLAWFGFLLPVWRVVRMVALVVVGALLVNRLEREAEEGAYHD